MQGEGFEPSGPQVSPGPPAPAAVTFDLIEGRVRMEGLSPRVLVPGDALAALLAAAGPDAACAFARELGRAIGQRAATRLEATAAAGTGAAAPGAGAGGSDADALRAASVETVTSRLADELALVGLGALGLERWGRALVLVLSGSPFGPAGDAVLEVVLASALGRASGRDAAAVLLERQGDAARFLVAGASGARRVRAWLASGLSWGEAVVRLHAPSSQSAALGERPTADAERS